MFSKRSKSTDSSVGSVGERTRNNSKEVTEEYITKAEERVKAVGEVTGLLEKSKIKGEELDNAIKEVFDKYVSELQPYRSFDTSFGCRTNKDLVPPPCLSEKSTSSNLDRISKIQRVFNSVPMFTNEDFYSIRDFLTSLNLLTTNLGFPLSKVEFEMALLGRIAPKVRAVLNSHKTEGLDSLYVNLLNLYDRSETRMEAFANLVSNKGKYNCFRTYLEETLRLISLSGKSKQQESQLLLHSLDMVLPLRI